MKKTLAAVAVLGAFAGTALAADVTLYGKIDGGLNYTHVSEESQDGAHISSSNSDDFTFKSGQNSGSRFGLKGTEQIADGLTVGFQLENGFSVDDGKMGQGSRLFGREARVYVQTEFGEVGFGRMGGLDSGLGSYDLIAGSSVFGTGWGEYTGTMDLFFKGVSDRYDNMITYKSPKFAGLTLVAQASLMKDSGADGDEGTHLADRYYAVGLGADYGALKGGLTFSMQDYAGFAGRHTGAEPGTDVNDKNANDSDGYTVTAFGSYDFGVTKVSLGAQYFDNVPVVFGKKIERLPRNKREEVFNSEVYSFTKKTIYNVVVDKKFIKPGEKILIVDDFLANACAVFGLIDVVKQAGAEVVGVGIVIEKGFQSGRAHLEDKGIRVESLVTIDKIEDGEVYFK